MKRIQQLAFLAFIALWWWMGAFNDWMKWPL